MKPWHIKRFTELAIGDPSFRAGLFNNPSDIVRQWGIDVDPRRLRFIWDPEYQERHDFGADDSDVQEYLAWTAAKREKALSWLRFLEEETPSPFREWRRRQANRYATQAVDGSLRRKRLLPCAIELSKGCTIGCDYCGLAAERLQAVARFNRQKNQELFTQVLLMMKEFVGHGAATGFLYWATDPFDNPDYEKYLTVFDQILGIPPQTTTAAWGRNLRRTRSFLQLRQRMDGIWDRFSVNSLDDLYLLMQNFSARELANVELVLHNPGSLREKCVAGRGGEADSEAKVGSIACVSGFLINLHDRSIRLISPCTDFERWPLGYAIYKEGNFRESIGQLKEFVSECETEVFGKVWDECIKPKLRSDFKKIDDGLHGGPIALKTNFARLVFNTELEKSLLRAINGERSIGELIKTMSHNYHPAQTYQVIKDLHENGVFEHLPEQNSGCERVL